MEQPKLKDYIDRYFETTPLHKIQKAWKKAGEVNTKAHHVKWVKKEGRRIKINDVMERLRQDYWNTVPEKLCNGCLLEGTHCEGRYCNDRMDSEIPDYSEFIKYVRKHHRNEYNNLSFGQKRIFKNLLW